jgi:peptidyl-prolyl cis-trans isomerase SurA
LTPSEKALTAAKEKITLIRNKIIDKKSLLLKLPEQNLIKKKKANGGSLINQNTRYSF